VPKYAPLHEDGWGSGGIAHHIELKGIQFQVPSYLSQKNKFQYPFIGGCVESRDRLEAAERRKYLAVAGDRTTNHQSSCL
jgi:hypothetical protein